MGPLGALRGPLETDFGPLDGLGPSRAIPGPLLGLPWALLGGPGRLSGPLLAALGCSWASLGPPWGAPGGSLRRSWRLPGGSWGPLGGSKVAFCRKAEFRRQYSVFHGFWGVREASWRLLGLSWSPRGGPWGHAGASWASWVLLGRAGLLGQAIFSRPFDRLYYFCTKTVFLYTPFRFRIQFFVLKAKNQFPNEVKVPKDIFYKAVHPK